jgi:hypothetical protein
MDRAAVQTCTNTERAAVQTGTDKDTNTESAAVHGDKAGDGHKPGLILCTIFRTTVNVFISSSINPKVKCANFFDKVFESIMVPKKVEKYCLKFKTDPKIRMWKTA